MKMKRVLFPVFAVAVGSVAGVVLAKTSILSPLRPAAPVRSTRSKSMLNVAQQQVPQIESELITATPHGFEPREITRPQAQFLLMIDDRSSLDQLDIRLSREGGAEIRQISVSREAPDWSEVINLEAGQYLLTEANHPSWTCGLTITGQ